MSSRRHHDRAGLVLHRLLGQAGLEILAEQKARTYAQLLVNERIRDEVEYDVNLKAELETLV